MLGECAVGLAVGSMFATPVAASAADLLSLSLPRPDDRRYGKLHHLDAYFPMEVPATKEAWLARAALLRRQVLVANGLWPMPPRLPIDAVVHGKVERDDYTVERVYFQSYPGLYVTGSLFRPKNATGPRPLVLCPHGHWRDGRFFDHGELIVRDEIKKGAEKFPGSGRFPLQARCVQLARMGCVVFHYDMLGYADSVPFPQGLAHGFRQQRPEMSLPNHWGLFSAQAELRLLSPMGFQTFNSVRALDWATTLPDVDTARIGVTGASGGGTQTFILTAVDDRPTAAFPAVMVSTAMQGGCTCENASYLRVGTGNIELAALCAPRPLGMSAADDWTKDLETKGLPELKQLYALMGAPDNVEGKYLPFPHNYNYPSRHLMYEFFNKHLSLGQTSPIEERDFVPLTQDELTVWTSEHVKPAMDLAAEKSVLAVCAQVIDDQLRVLAPKDSGTLAEYQRVVGGGWSVLIGRGLTDPADISVDLQRQNTIGSASYRVGYLKHARFGESIPTVHFDSPSAEKKFTLWITPRGKEDLRPGDRPPAFVSRLLEAGSHVVGLDLLDQGDTTSPDRPPGRARTIENGREAACFVLGYNHSLFAQRVHDILTAITLARSIVGEEGRIDLVGIDGAGPWVAAAAWMAGPAVDRVALSTRGFRFAHITDIEDPQLLPGAVRFGDIPGLIGLLAPKPVLVLGEGNGDVALPRDCYRAAGSPDQLVLSPTKSDEATTIVNWLTAG
jgi:dienelactone hydrolase